MQLSLFDLMVKPSQRVKIKRKLRVTFVWKGEDWDFVDIFNSNIPVEVKYYVCTPLIFYKWDFLNKL